MERHKLTNNTTDAKCLKSVYKDMNSKQNCNNIYGGNFFYSNSYIVVFSVLDFKYNFSFVIL